MPGPVSDSYDPEFGTGSNCELIREGLSEMHKELGRIIGGPPIFILDVFNKDDGPLLQAELTEKQWRILRFACERAVDSV